MATDAPSHFSGKRQSERRTLDVRVELVGGGVTLQGRAVDLSSGGVAVRLNERTLQGFREASDAVGAFRVLERHFTSGLVVRFPVQGDVRVPARIVRVVTSPRPGGDLDVGLRFARPLGADEWARVTETRRLAPIPALAPVTAGPAIQVLVVDPTAGPVCLMRARRGAAGFVEGVVESQRPIAVDELRERLGIGPLPTRVCCGPATWWSGDAVTRNVRGSPTEGLFVTIETSTPLPDAFVRRLGTPR